VSPQRRRSSTRSTSRRKAAPRRDFWDGGVGDDEPVALVRSPEDPSAMIRSLGPPPLPGRETIAEHYFAAAYDKAARRAVALAAASGLMDVSEPED
jgi:predicted acylesterase/phospholipase RssA